MDYFNVTKNKNKFYLNQHFRSYINIRFELCTLCVIDPSSHTWVIKHIRFYCELKRKCFLCVCLYFPHDIHMWWTTQYLRLFYIDLLVWNLNAFLIARIHHLCFTRHKEVLTRSINYRMPFMDIYILMASSSRLDLFHIRYKS